VTDAASPSAAPPSAASRSQAVARLRRLDVCAVSDALDRLGLPSSVGGIAQHSGTGRIAGCVIAVRLGVGKPADGTPRHLCSTAIERGGPDDVIVVEQRTGIEAGSWGGLLSLGAAVRGIAGVIADGPVRDIDEARSLGFPVFARSLTARTARGRIVELGTDLTLSIGGVRVDTGDYVIADNSAVAFIPAARIDQVLDAAEAIASREQAMAEAIRAGTPIGQVMGGDYENMLRR
jgi:4-hydroxy-4-methyl-2-oxoglutarate aldolase